MQRYLRFIDVLDCVVNPSGKQGDGGQVLVHRVGARIVSLLAHVGLDFEAIRARLNVQICCQFCPAHP